MLLADRPDRSGGEQNRGASALERSLENSFPARIRRSRWSSHRDICKRISGPVPSLFKLKVGHARLGCTSHANPGMEIALPPVPANDYTDPE